MAKKHLKPLEDQPSTSSSDEEEEGEEEESDYSYDEDELMDPVKIPARKEVKSPSAGVPGAANQTSDSEIETDPDSETERALNPGSGKATAKEAEPSGKKKASSRRLWSEEDEINMLQGMIDLVDAGKSPYEDKKELYEAVKESISAKVSFNQFTDKIRSLKKKYIGLGRKKCYWNAHDQKLFEMSKYIWGSDGVAAVKSLRPKRRKVKEERNVGDSEWFEKSFVVGAIVGFGVDELYVKQRWSMVPMETKKRLEEKWKALQVKEFEYVLQKTNFLSEVTSLMAEAS